MRFLTTKQIAGEIEGIMRSANEFIILISPFLNISDMYIERLAEATNKKIKVDIVFGNKDMRKFEQVKLSNIKKLNIYYLKMLHAKCYINENDAVITSMNLYEYSEMNREMGIHVSKDENVEIYNEIYNEAISIIKNADNYYINEQVNENRGQYVGEPTGTCIRCGVRVSLDNKRPLCTLCYKTWTNFSDEDYKENYCHICGKEHNSSMRKPLCRSCFHERGMGY